MAAIAGITEYEVLLMSFTNGGLVFGHELGTNLTQNLRQGMK